MQHFGAHRYENIFMSFVRKSDLLEDLEFYLTILYLLFLDEIIDKNGPGRAVHIYKALSLVRQKQEDVPKFEVSLVYGESSKPAKFTQKKPISERK